MTQAAEIHADRSRPDIIHQGPVHHGMIHQGLEGFSITRRAIDPRADGASRMIRLSAGAVTIDRTLDGVRMRIGVPTAAYRDLVICVRASSGRATLRLRHDDEDLDVVIGSGEAEEVARTARAWSAVTGKPVAIEFGGVTLRDPYARARKRQKAARRSRFARRRSAGVTVRLGTSFSGEREIIARG